MMHTLKTLCGCTRQVEDPRGREYCIPMVAETYGYDTRRFERRYKNEDGSWTWIEVPRSQSDEEKRLHSRIADLTVEINARDRRIERLREILADQVEGE